MKTSRKYFVTLLAIGGLWSYLFYPYFADPRYLYTTTDVVHYRKIDATLQELRNIGRINPTAHEVSSLVRLSVPETGKVARELTGAEKEQRVAYLLPYMEGDNYMPLVYKPLFRDEAWMGILCVGAIVLFLIYHYTKDPPKTAYLEKIALLLLPYCCFEALHFYVFRTTRSWENLYRSEVLGQYFSMSTMLVLLVIFYSRLKFIPSVEGKFYERRVLTDAKSITRWRDAFDNWILRQFMNPEELERRFFIRRKSEP